jgi:uridine kinase
MADIGDVVDSFLKSGRKAIFVEGIDASGKTYFANALKDELEVHGEKGIVIGLDEFLQDENKRIVDGISSAKLYFESWFDFKRLQNEVLAPFFTGAEIEKELITYDELTKKRSSRTLRIKDNEILVLEGVFLSNELLRNYPAFRIYLEVPYELSLERQLLREPIVRKLAKQEIIFRWENWHLPAQETYLKRFRPKENADMVINNSSPENFEILR